MTFPNRKIGCKIVNSRALRYQIGGKSDDDMKFYYGRKDEEGNRKWTAFSGTTDFYGSYWLSPNWTRENPNYDIKIIANGVEYLLDEDRALKVGEL